MIKSDGRSTMFSTQRQVYSTKVKLKSFDLKFCMQIDSTAKKFEKCPTFQAFSYLLFYTYSSASHMLSSHVCSPCVVQACVCLICYACFISNRTGKHKNIFLTNALVHHYIVETKACGSFSS
jgi:hypothetical protein